MVVKHVCEVTMGIVWGDERKLAPNHVATSSEVMLGEALTANARA